MSGCPCASNPRPSGALARRVEEREVDHGGGDRPPPGLDRPLHRKACPGPRMCEPDRGEAQHLLEDRAPTGAGDPPDLAAAGEDRNRHAAHDRGCVRGQALCRVERLDLRDERASADPQSRWLRMNAHGLDVEVRDVSESVAAVALQGPLSRDVLEAATGVSFADLRYFRRRRASLAGIPIDVSRTGYTGDLGYELWVPADRAVEAWDALVAAGEPYRVRPAGMLALDVVRLEAGLILIEADYTSAIHSHIPSQNYSPYEIGLDKLVDLAAGDFIGRRALVAEMAAGGPPRRLVGLD